MSWMIELLVPVSQSSGHASDDPLRALQTELTSRFGGVTAYARSPAKGRWTDDAGSEQRDDVVLIEVLAEELDRDWWGDLRNRLEARLEQSEILIRAHQVQRL